MRTEGELKVSDKKSTVASSFAATSETVAEPKRSGDKITVACKLPSGLLLRLCRMEDSSEQSPMGIKTIKVARWYGDQVRINGVAARTNPAPNDSAFAQTGGYALTPGVDREFFEEWLRQNADAEVVRNEIIFAHGSDADVRRHTRDNEKVRSGMEPIDPEKPPMRGIQPAERNATSSA